MVLFLRKQGRFLFQTLLCTLHHESDEPMYQRDGKSYEMQPGQWSRQKI
ncbi:MAG: hypothetical protein KatS3mg049_0749 [Caldilinea sp.]|nr:MAG: hypothetical protein KatS3mg049_0749 [Caldilinea sp.]